MGVRLLTAFYKKKIKKLDGWIDLLAAETLEWFSRDYGAPQWWEWGWDNIYSSNSSTNIVAGCRLESKFLSKINDAEKAAYDVCDYSIWLQVSATTEQPFVSFTKGKTLGRLGWDLF